MGASSRNLFRRITTLGAATEVAIMFAAFVVKLGAVSVALASSDPAEPIVSAQAWLENGMENEK